jgi:hypothetical protein
MYVRQAAQPRAAYVEIPNGASRVDARGANQIWARLAPVKRRQRRAKLRVFVLRMVTTDSDC